MKKRGYKDYSIDYGKHYLRVIIVNVLLIIALFGVVSVIKSVPYVEENQQDKIYLTCLLADVVMLIIWIWAISKSMRELLENNKRIIMAKRSTQVIEGTVTANPEKYISSINRHLYRRYSWSPRITYPLVRIVYTKYISKMLVQDSQTKKEYRAEIKSRVKDAIKYLGPDLGKMELISFIFLIVHFCTLFLLLMNICL
ncbi:MAG: hypothetical protein U0L79_01165 [Lachnospiraceae bacterium]|nr:hypothetical protein [Lachnospiraceae bacterium]